MSALGLALVLAAIGLPPAAPPPVPPPPASEARLDVTGRLGGVVGHVLLVPYALPAPSLAATAKIAHAFGERFFVDGELRLGAGLVPPADVAVGYLGRGTIGVWWFDVGWAALASDAHGGIASLALLPLPRVGLGHELVLRPYVGDVVGWDVSARLDTDLHLVFPAVNAAVATTGRLTLGAFVASLEVGAEADVFVGFAFNSAGAGVYAKGGAGMRF